MRITRTPKAPDLLLWNGSGGHFGYSVGRHHFFFACRNGHFDVIMQELGCTAAETNKMRREWHFGSWGRDASLLPREPGLWVQPYRGARFKRLYPIDTVKRLPRTRLS